MKSGFLVSVGREIAPEAMNALKTAYGEIGAVNLELFSVRATASANDVRATIQAAVKADRPHILVVEVSDCSYRGPGEVSHAAGLLKA